MTSLPAWRAWAGALLATSACNVIAGIGDLPYPPDAPDGVQHAAAGPDSGDDASLIDAAMPASGDAPREAGPAGEGSATGEDSAPARPDASLDAPGEASGESSPGSSPDATGADGGAPSPLDAGALFVQANARYASGTGSGTIGVTVTLGGAVKAQDALVVAAAFSIPAAPQLVDSLGNTFGSPIVGPFGNGQGYPWCAIWYVPHSPGGTESVTATLQAGTVDDLMSLYVQEYTGLGGVDVTAENTGSSTAIDSGALATTGYNDLIFAFAASGSVSPGAGFAPRSTMFSNVTEDRIAWTPGSYDAIATVNGSGGTWVIVAAAFTTE